jgi:hypothetical protein
MQCLSFRGLSDLSRRDKRTEPGVLTPGIDPTHERTLKGSQTVRFKSRSTFGSATSASAAPSGRTIFSSIPGVKTPGLVLLSLRDKSGGPIGAIGELQRRQSGRLLPQEKPSGCVRGFTTYATGASRGTAQPTYHTNKRIFPVLPFSAAACALPASFNENL